MNEFKLLIITWIGYFAGLMLEAMPIFQGISFITSIIVGIFTIVYLFKKIIRLDDKKESN